MAHASGSWPGPRLWPARGSRHGPQVLLKDLHRLDNLPAMVMHVVRLPEVLRWSNFVNKPGKLRDPNDGSEIEALTRFHFTFPQGMKPNGSDGASGLMFPEKWQITIRPDAKVWKDSQKGGDMLAHEQLHYLFGYVTARALMNELMALRTKRTLLKSAMGTRASPFT